MAQSQTLQIVLDLKDKASKELERGFGGQVKNLEKDLKKAQKVSGIAFAAIGTSIGFAVKEFAKFEQAEVAFESMLGSAEEAKELIQDLAEFSAKTPFQFEDIVQATRTLVAFGFSAKEAKESIEFLGDISAGAQIPLSELSQIFGKVQTKGKAMTEELLQLAERGIPIIDALAEEFDTTKEAIFDMAEDGELSFDRIESAMKGLTEDGAIFANQMEKQSQTISGLFSTLKDNVSILMAEVGAVFANTSGDMIENVTKLVAVLKEWIRENPALTKLIIGLAAAITGLTFALTTFGLLIPKVVLGMTFLTAGFAKMGISLAALFGPVGILTGALTALAFVITNEATRGVNEMTNTLDRLRNESDKNIKRMFALRDGTDEYTTSIDVLKGEIKGLEKEMATVGKSVEKINKQIADAVKDSNERQADIKKSTAELFIEQEEKVAKITEEIEEKKEEMKKLKDEEATSRMKRRVQEEITQLQTQLEKEESALESSSEYKKGLENEFQEARRRASLTEFERQLEDLQKESQLEKIRLQEKLSNLEIEKQAVVKQQNEIAEKIKEKKDEIKTQEEKRVEAEIKQYIKSAEIFIKSERAKAVARGQSTSSFDKQLKDLQKEEERVLKNLDSISEGAAIKEAQTVASESNNQTRNIVNKQKEEDDFSFFDSFKNPKKTVTDFFKNADFSLNDGVINPDGKIISTHPNDYLIATKDPSSLGGGGSVFNININTMIGEEEYAEKIGNMLIKQTGLNTSI